MAGRPLRLALALGTLLGPGPSPPAAAQASGSWQPEDRLLVADFSNVVALASDGRRIHAATPHGLISYDPLRRRWLPPFTWEDGYPVPEEPSALAWSPGGQELVLGTRRGGLWRIDNFAGRAEPAGGVPGPVEELRAGSLGELYVRTAGRWLVLEPGGVAARPAAGPVPGGRARPDGRLEALRGTLSLGPQLRRWRISAIEPGTVPDEFFVGTAGGGLVRVDARTLEVEPLPFGVVTRAVTALGRFGGRLWFGGDIGSAGRGTIAAADTALLDWYWADRLEGAPTGPVAAFADAGGSLWAGTGDGLYRLGEGGRRWSAFDQRDGLPSGRVTAFATLDSTLWVGTSRGACLWQAASCGPTLLPGEAIVSLSYCRGALWMATNRELWRATGSELSRAGPPGLAGGPDAGLACHDDVLYLASRGWLAVHGPAGWLEPQPVPVAGAIRAVAASENGIWIGTDAGAAHWDPTRRTWSRYVVPQDIPFGPVLGVLQVGPHLWLATPGGAVRLDTRHH